VRHGAGKRKKGGARPAFWGFLGKILAISNMKVPTLSGGRRTFAVVPSFFWYISTEED